MTARIPLTFQEKIFIQISQLMIAGGPKYALCMRAARMK
jgi:hypothetical protein